jgi:hypothetical protein
LIYNSFNHQSQLYPSTKPSLSPPYRQMSLHQNLSRRSMPATIKTYLPLKPNLESIALEAPEIVRAGLP